MNKRTRIIRFLGLGLLVAACIQVPMLALARVWTVVILQGIVGLIGLAMLLASFAVGRSKDASEKGRA